MVRQKTSVSFSDSTREMIEKFCSYQPGMNKFSSKAEEIIRDYSALLERTKRELSNIFSESELNYIYDMLNGTLIYPEQISIRSILTIEIKDVDRYEELGKKWKVDVKELVKKVSNLSEFQAYGLVKMAHEWWANK